MEKKTKKLYQRMDKIGKKIGPQEIQLSDDEQKAEAERKLYDAKYKVEKEGINDA